MGIILSRAWNALGALGSSLEALGWDFVGLNSINYGILEWLELGESSFCEYPRVLIQPILEQFHGESTPLAFLGNKNQVSKEG